MPEKASALRLYRWLLRVYPHGFRQRYQQEMLLDFRDNYNDILKASSFWGMTGFWINITLDLIYSAIQERLRDADYRGPTAMYNIPQFNNQLVSTIEFWTRLLRSGYSVRQILELAGKHAPEPTAGFIRETLAKAEETGDLAGAIASMPERLDSPYLRQVVQVIMRQHETGGNLADMMAHLKTDLSSQIGGENWADHYDYDNIS